MGIAFLVAGVIASTGPVIANHTTTHLSQIPASAFDQARSNLHIAYGHTSHGSQIITGMTGLMTFAGAPYGGLTYSWNNGGTGGALDVRDNPFSGAYDLGNPDYTSWATATRTYLNTHPEVNVVMWSWCGELSWTWEPETVVTSYLNQMNQLESDYPHVKFVYMTGHLDGSGPQGVLNLRNEKIRTYARTNNKILFDFADIESYDPDGVYYGNKNATDGCNYDYNNNGVTTQSGDPAVPTNGDRNWASDWQNSHRQGTDWYSCSPAHTQPLNANQKAYAAWWLWARLGGWDGGGSRPVAPVAGFSATPLSGTAPLTVVFKDTSTNTPTSWNWSFGDGSLVNATQKNPVHTYANAGTYTVSLNATNAGGYNSTKKAGYITVSAPALRDKISIYRNGSWYFDMNGNGVWDAGDQNSGFGAPLWTPVTGDWNNDGHAEIGVYRDGAWYLDYDSSGWWSAGDRNYGYGAPGWTPVVGDWNGDGSDTIGVYKDGAWYLDYDGSGTVNTGDKNFAFGSAGWTPVVGKWTTGGKSKVGVYKNGIYYLDSNGDNVFGAGDKTITYGTTGSTAITGDWNANSLTEVGTQTGKSWKLDYDGLGAVNASTKSYTFGADGWKPVIGDWNGDGKDKIGICLNGAWYLDYNGNGIWDAGTDRNFAFGSAGWTPVAGKWE